MCVAWQKEAINSGNILLLNQNYFGKMQDCNNNKNKRRTKYSDIQLIQSVETGNGYDFECGLLLYQSNKAISW